MAPMGFRISLVIDVIIAHRLETFKNDLAPIQGTDLLLGLTA